MRKNFQSPIFSDPAKTLGARLIYMILWMIVVAATAGAIASLFLPEAAGRWLFASASGSAYVTSLLLFKLIRRGYTKLASWIIVFFCWGIATALCFTGGGIHSLSISLYIIVVLIAGLLLGEIIGIITGVFCALTEFLLFIAELQGVLPPISVAHTLQYLFFGSMVFLATTVTIQYIAARTVKESFQRIITELKERKNAESALRESESIANDNNK